MRVYFDGLDCLTIRPESVVEAKALQAWYGEYEQGTSTLIIQGTTHKGWDEIQEFDSNLMKGVKLGPLLPASE